MFARKHIFRRTVLFRQARLELRENVQIRRQRYAIIQILRVASRPEETLAGSALQAFDVNRAAAENGFIGGAEIVADNGHQADRCEKPRGHGEIGGGAAERAVHLPVRAFQGVISN